MKQLKRILSLAIVLAMAFSMLPLSAFATTEEYPVINAGDVVTVELTNSIFEVYYKFVPETSGSYAVYSYDNGEIDTYGYIYDSELNTLVSDDDSNSNLNFRMNYYFTAGETYYIGATSLGGMAIGTYSMTIESIPAATSIELSPSVINGYVDETYWIEAYLHPEGAFETITWTSSNPDVAEHSYGNIYLKSAGTATITATSESGLTATCEVTVSERPDATSIELSPSVINGYVDDTYEIRAYLYPEEASETITWTSSNSDVAEYSYGDIYLKSAGTATITATTESGLTATCEVTVSERPAATSIELSPSVINGYVDETYWLEAYLYPEGASEIITWTSSNPDVAECIGYSSGSDIYLKSAGTATITATTESGLTATCEVTVSERPVATSIEFTRTTIDGYADESYWLGTYLYPEGASEIITWTSSNPDVAECIGYSSGSDIYLKSAGTATITATTESGLTATCEVTVSERPVATSIELSPSVINGYVDETYWIWAYLHPEGAFETITWTSSNPDVAECTGYNSGSDIYLKSAGTATITATTESGLTATCEVIVSERPAATSIELSSSSVYGIVGEKINIYYSFLPEGVVYEPVTWSSDNTAVATVNADGTVTLLSQGTATITVTSENGLTDECAVNVIAPVDIALDEEVTLNTDVNSGIGVYKFVPEISGTYAFYSYNETLDPCAYLYDSDMELLEYNDDGGEFANFRIQYELTAGETYYYKAKPLGDDSNGSFCAKIIKLVPLTSISIEYNRNYGYADEVIWFELIYPDNAVFETPEWSVSNTAVARIFATHDDGMMVGIEFISPGTTTLTVTTENGLTESVEITCKAIPEIVLDEVNTFTPVDQYVHTYFNFTPAETGFYRFEFDDSDAYNAYEMDIYDSDGTHVASSFDTFNVQLNGGETYRVSLYNYQIGTYSFTVKKALAIEKLELISLPDEMEYYHFEGFDYDGLQLRATMEDGTTVDWAESYSANNSIAGYGIEFNNSYDENGDYTGTTVSCGGQEVSFEFEIIEVPIESIEIVSAGSAEYYENCNGYWTGRYNEETGEHEDYFRYYIQDLSDVQIKVNFKDGTSETVCYNDYSYDGYDFYCEHNQSENPWTLGSDNYLTIWFMDVSAELQITILENPIERIEIVKAPTKQYIYGDTEYGYIYDDGTYDFYPDDLTGFEMKVYYTDGTSKVFTDEDAVEYQFDGFDYGIEGQNIKAAGTYSVKFEYMNATAEYDVTVIPCPIESIEIISAPDVTEYSYYFSPDYIGLEFRVNYTDGTSETVKVTEDNIHYNLLIEDSSCKVSFGDYSAKLYIGYDYETEQQYAAISCYGVTTIIEDIVFVDESEVEEIEFSNVTLTGEGMKVDVTFADGTSESLTLDVIASNRYPAGTWGYARTELGILYFEVYYIGDSDNPQEYGIYIFWNEYTAPLAPEYVRGDVNGDGEVKTADYIILKRILLGARKTETLDYPETAFDRCDVNADGEVKTGDYILLKRALLGAYKIPD